MRNKSIAAALGLTLCAVCALTAPTAALHAADSGAYSGADTDDAVTSPPTAAAQSMDSGAASGASRAAAAPDTITPAVQVGPDLGALPLSGSMQDQVLQMKNRVLAQQDQIRQLKAELGQVSANTNAQFGEAMPEQSAKEQGSGDMLFDVAGPNNHSAEEVPLVWRRLSLLVNIDLEYTSQYNSAPGPGGVGQGASAGYVQPALPNGEEGMYFGHVDLHFKYRFNDSMFAKLDYNLSALELDDVGVGWQQLPFPPLTSGWGDYTYSVFIGQKRQSFGIEQQTDARNLMFPNRAMMFGGPNPFGPAAKAAADPFDLYDQTTTIGGGQQPNSAASGNLVAELVYERTLGIHFYHAHDFGFLAYNLGVDIVNDESEDSVPGGGTDSLKTGFPLQTEDQDVSEIGRLGLQPSALNDLLPFGAQFNFGVSAFHDPENTQYYASQMSEEEWADAQGLDATLQTDRDVLYLQSEYVKRDQYGPSFTTAGLVPNDEYGGLQGRAESWYLAASVQPWRIFDADAPQVELLGRYENYCYDDVSDWLRLALGPYTGSFNATTIALKYTYMGNCHTSINYTTYGLDNNFNAAGATALLQLEQQVNF
ncbi:MAG TPA: hypothetical protein VK914_00990 [bacterium]|jgi:hypothetical protein|nr:hypothetical protein [bacterium]